MPLCSLLSAGAFIGSAQPGAGSPQTQLLLPQVDGGAEGMLQWAPQKSEALGKSAASSWEQSGAGGVQPSPGTTGSSAACLVGRLGTADGHKQERRDMRGHDLPANPPDSGKTQLNTRIFSAASWELPAFSLTIHFQVYSRGSQPTLCSYINQTLVQNIIEENSDKPYVYHSPLEGEKEKERKRKKQPDFWFWKQVIYHI